MATVLVIKFQDMSGETSSFSAYLPALAGDGSNWAAILAARDAFITAVTNSFAGQVMSHKLIADNTRVTNVKPTDGDREEKIEIRYQDDVTLQVHHLTIPCRDKANWDWDTNSDFTDMTGGVVALQDAFISAVTTNLVSPAGNAVTIISIEKVGRNL